MAKNERIVTLKFRMEISCAPLEEPKPVDEFGLRLVNHTGAIPEV